MLEGRPLASRIGSSSLEGSKIPAVYRKHTSNVCKGHFGKLVLNEWKGFLYADNTLNIFVSYLHEIVILATLSVLGLDLGWKQLEQVVHSLLGTHGLT